MKQAAIANALNGLAVFPCKGKQPAIKGGFKAASSDRAVVGRWDWNGRNIGLPMQPNGLVAVDVDDIHAWEAFRAENDMVADPETLTQRTPSGGFHFIFKAPADMKGQTQILTSGGRLVGETRWNGYVVIAPSKGYKFDGPFAIARCAECPDWVPRGSTPPPVAENTAVETATVTSWRQGVELVEQARGKPGGRHRALLLLGNFGRRKGKRDWQNELRRVAAANGYEDNIDRLIADIENKVRPSGRPDLFVAHALETMGVSIRRNLLSMEIETRKGDGAWKAMQDDAHASLFSHAQDAGRISESRFRIGIHALCHEHRVDPVRERLERLPAWDRCERIKGLLELCFTLTGDPEIASFAIRNVLVGVVRRTYEPGAKHDQMPILFGPQDAGKSLFWKCLTLDPDWFGDSLTFEGDDKQRIEAMLGNVIVEGPEMVAFTKRDIAAIKSFVSRPVDQMRLSYERYTRRLPRRAILVGTSNDMTGLPNDHTGNRRFIPVGIVSRAGLGSADHVMAVVDAEREQLWAEALHLYRQGETGAPDTRMKALLMRETEQYRGGDEVMENALALFLDPDAWAEACQEMRYRDAHGGVPIDCILRSLIMSSDPTNMGIQRKAAAILAGMGCRRGRVKNQRLWFAPKPEKPAAM